MLSKVLNGISAGLMVSIGCAVFLACENKVVGSILFTIALLVICFRGYSLYTGKIGFISFSHTKEDFSVLLLGLLGNAIGMIAFGLLISVALPNIKEKAVLLCLAKLEQTWAQTVIRGLFCGVLMFIAVYVYKENKSIVAIIFAIPTFILCGFEHSVADIGYYAIANMFSFEIVLFILLVVVGNTIGSMILPYLQIAQKSKAVVSKEKQDEKAS
ncbi:MAG: formate/nitrite transporter family protein [Clostridiales bacterium]|nr:formate/nitrite transporter family protein [Clostridiales bacterium]